ncbi:MAG TPA: MEDS domain-containing protein [Acidimicrobiales bacterium]|nr:MEDS domain-containing protein [Acidimicrobiales bacterium]
MSVKSARERAGLSREELAYRSRLSWAAIAQIESGRRQQVRLGSLVALSNALAVSVDYLVGVNPSEEPKLLEHRLFAYDSDDDYAASTGRFLAEGIERSDSTLAVTGRRQTELIRDALGEHAAHVEFRDSTEWYRSPRAALEGFRDFIKESFASGSPWVRVIGEPVWDGRSKAEVVGWIRYESIINLALSSSPATVVCPYDERTLPEEVLAGAHMTHPEVEGVGDAASSVDYQQPEEFLLEVR